VTQVGIQKDQIRMRYTDLLDQKEDHKRLSLSTVERKK